MSSGTFGRGTLLCILTLLVCGCVDGNAPHGQVASKSPAKPDKSVADKSVATRLPAKVEIRSVHGGYQLFRDGEPYLVKGVGLGIDHPDSLEFMRSLKAHGGNSFRTWNVGDGAFLDAAHELGLTVALGLDVQRERHGFDYDDVAAVAQQLAKFEQLVLAHRDHPALLAWVIGNELNHDFSNPRVYDAVNDISRMIHRLDPHHPTTTTTAGIDAELAQIINDRAPDLDFVSIQVYGGLFDLQQALGEIELPKPLMVTEWGTIGHWEVPQTAWGAPIELNSRDKAATYVRGYAEVLQPLGRRLIGNYAFLWAQKQERTPTWYGMFTASGAPTEAVDAMHYIWQGVWPENRAPSLQSLTLDGKTADQSVRLLADTTYGAQVAALDREGDELEVRWQLMRESTAQQSGGDHEDLPEILSSSLHILPVTSSLPEASPSKKTSLRSVQVRTPAAPGAYRLFVFVADSRGQEAHANIPFFVEHAG